MPYRFCAHIRPECEWPTNSSVHFSWYQFLIVWLMMILFQHIEAFRLAISGKVFFHTCTGFRWCIIAGRFLLIHFQFVISFIDGAECFFNCFILPWIRPRWNILDVNQFIHVVGQTQI